MTYLLPELLPLPPAGDVCLLDAHNSACGGTPVRVVIVDVLEQLLDRGGDEVSGLRVLVQDGSGELSVGHCE